MRAFSLLLRVCGLRVTGRLRAAGAQGESKVLEVSCGNCKSKLSFSRQKRRIDLLRAGDGEDAPADD